MKKICYLLLLLCLPFLLPAKNKPGYFPLRPGDWFEMQVTRGPENGPYSSAEPTFLFTERHHFRYHLLKQLPDGHQQYRIVQERGIYHHFEGTGNGWVGYDSYYPVYKQGLQKQAPQSVYTLEISADGQIVYLSADANQPPLPVILTNYSPKREVNTSVTFTYPPLDTTTLRGIVTSMLAWRNKTTALPVRIPGDTKGYSQLLVATSFPMTGNTYIMGKIDNPLKKELAIRIGDSTWKCPVNNNGEFMFPLFLKDPQEGNISIENHNSCLFLLPGDTLIVHADNTGIVSFKGTAGRNTQLANDIISLFYPNDEVSQMQRLHNITAVLALQQKETAAFNTILQSYKNKATPLCLDYYKTSWQYHMAADRLYFLCLHNYQADSSQLPFQHIPEEVTISVDNIPLIINPYPQIGFYKKYLDWFLLYQQARISLPAGGNTEALSFYTDYFAILSTLKGYPQYYKLAQGLDRELKNNSWTSNQQLKPYYEDFIRNCGDSSFTTSLIKNWQLMERWAPGNTLPVQPLPMSNGNTYEVKSEPGKITCLLFDDFSTITETAYRQLIQSLPEVHFVYAWMNSSQSPGNRDSLLKTLPNVTCIELQDKGDKNYDTYGLDQSYRTNFVVLDQWGRIVDDHIVSQDEKWTHLKEIIKTAATIPRFSQAAKANVMNIIGWSLGSILLTASAAIWIYRIRIGRIKQAESMKNMIRELEIKAIRSQMNPHFIFNALNSIQSLINTAQYKEANNYLVKFSLLLRSVLQNAEKNTLPLLDELITIRLYCELEQLRFDFSFEIDIAEDIAADLIEIPGMILQPLVENAIIHGIAGKGKEGFLHIKTTRQGALLQITIYDNGQGFSPAPARSKSHKSIGLKLVKERLLLFSGHEQTASLRFTNGNGTTALLTIPIEQA